MDNNLRINAIELSPKEQFELRKRIVNLRKKGMPSDTVANILDVSLRHVQSTWKKYKEGGIKAIGIKTMGRQKGTKRILSLMQEKEIQKIIVDKYPEQIKIKGCLWTRQNIGELIKRMYGISLPLSTLGVYLRRWGFSVQRPAKRAYKQNPEQVNKWMEEEYPAIKELAEEEKGEIFWGDETGIQNASNYAKGYAPIGQTPVLRIEVTKFKINMMSAITNQGKLRFMLYKDNMNADRIIDFMRRLIVDTDRKVFLILDNLRAHHSKKVTNWLSDKKEKIEVFYLPPYSPEYNPDEYLNGDLKRNIGVKAQARSVDDIEKSTRSFMKKLQLNRVHVKSYFKHKQGFICIRIKRII